MKIEYTPNVAKLIGLWAKLRDGSCIDNSRGILSWMLISFPKPRARKKMRIDTAGFSTMLRDGCVEFQSTRNTERKRSMPPNYHEVARFLEQIQYTQDCQYMHGCPNSSELKELTDIMKEINRIQMVLSTLNQDKYEMRPLILNRKADKDTESLILTNIEMHSRQGMTMIAMERGRLSIRAKVAKLHERLDLAYGGTHLGDISISDEEPHMTSMTIDTLQEKITLERSEVLKKMEDEMRSMAREVKAEALDKLKKELIILGVLGEGASDEQFDAVVGTLADRIERNLDKISSYQAFNSLIKQMNEVGANVV